MEYTLIAPKIYEPIEQVLVNRGIRYEDIGHYLNTTKQDNLPPTFFKNIEKATCMLCKHIANPKGIIDLIVDCDADGYLSAALVLNYMHSRWPSSINKVRYILHDSKMHGIEPEKLSQNVTLVLVPDAGSNQYEIHQELRARGIDILILDHHQAEYESPDACVVNNQLCDYPTKSLCGCAVVYKLFQYIDFLLGEEGYVDQFLDIVAVSLSNIGLIYLFQ